MGVGSDFGSAHDPAEGHQQTYPEPDLIEATQPRGHVDKYAHLAPRDYEPGVARVVDQGYDEVTIRRDGTDYVHPVLIGEGRTAISPYPIDEVQTSSPWRQTYDGGADLDTGAESAYMNTSYGRGGVGVADRDNTGWQGAEVVLDEGLDANSSEGAGRVAIAGVAKEWGGIPQETQGETSDKAGDLTEVAELSGAPELDGSVAEVADDPRAAILETNPAELLRVVDGFRSAADEMLKTFTEGEIAQGMDGLRRYPEILGTDDPSYVVTEVAAGDHKSEKPNPEDADATANEQKEPDPAPEAPRVDPQWTSEAAWSRDTLMDGTAECAAIEHAHKSVQLAGEIAAALGRLRSMMDELGFELNATAVYRTPLLDHQDVTRHPPIAENPRADAA
jgi:hypothetical protein